MKALELLREYKSIDYGCDMSDLHQRIDEAITELEAMQNKSCVGCKHELSDDCNICGGCDRFYADRWEAKDE
jgi:hypothetical protein